MNNNNNDDNDDGDFKNEQYDPTGACLYQGPPSYYNNNTSQQPNLNDGPPFITPNKQKYSSQYTETFTKVEYPTLPEEDNPLVQFQGGDHPLFNSSNSYNLHKRDINNLKKLSSETYYELQAHYWFVKLSELKQYAWHCFIRKQMSTSEIGVKFELI